MTAVSLARWQEAQRGEAEFWAGEDRTTLCRQLDSVYAKELGINAASTAGLSVLDIGGGPYPIATLLGLPVAHVTVVDPLPYAVTDAENVTRVVEPAEAYRGPLCDEVWGYNVLQHVVDPKAVLETAKTHARQTVRWFDWTDTKIKSHHPHSLTAEWIREQFADPNWRVLTFTRGTVMVGRVQRFVALIAERV